jgi:hypothetical protein
VIGGLALGGGVLDIGTAPLCKLSQIRASAQPACIGTSIGVGAALAGAGTALLVVGVGRRRAWETWKLGTAPTVGGATITVSGRW